MALPAYKFGRKISRVAVIGTGASGLAAVKALRGENAFDITVYERNGVSGGLWNYTEAVDNVTIPSSDPTVIVPPVGKAWTSAAYDGLITNVPTSIMYFENPEYTSETAYFAKRDEVADFLHVYSREVEGLISYHTNVTDVRKIDGDWVVKSEQDGQERVEKFDAVVVASGHFYLPYVPDVKGISEYAAKYPGRILHAKAYRRPEPYRNQTVLVVGNAASGIDIGNQLLEHGAKVYQSIRAETVKPSAKDESTKPGKPSAEIKPVGEIEYFAEDGTIHIKGGEVLSDVDTVIYATGYLRNLPFLSEINNGSKPLVTNGLFIDNLYLNFIYYEDPTLVVLGAPRFVLPFRVSQAQACLIARVWSGRLHLPPKRVMELHYQIRLKQVGPVKEFHDLKYPDDSDFCEYVRALCDLSTGDYGVVPRKWTRAERTIRGKIGDLRVAFSQYLLKTGKAAKEAEELLDAGLLKPLEIDTSEPEFAKFGKVKDGTEYTEDDVRELQDELLKLASREA